MSQPEVPSDSLRTALKPFGKVPFRFTVRTGCGQASVREILRLKAGMVVPALGRVNTWWGLRGLLLCRRERLITPYRTVI